MANDPQFTVTPTEQALKGSAPRLQIARPASISEGYVLQLVDAKIGQVKAEMASQIGGLAARLEIAETQRAADFRDIQKTFDDVKNSLPTKSDIRKTVLGGFGGVIGAAALAWAIFGAGSSMTGAFADKVLESKEMTKATATQTQILNAKMDKLLEAQTAKEQHDVKK